MSTYPAVYCSPTIIKIVKQEILTFFQATKLLQERWGANPKEIYLWLAYAPISGKPLHLFSRVDLKNCPDSLCQFNPMQNGPEEPANCCFSRVRREEIRKMDWAQLEHYLLRQDQVEAFTPAVEQLESIGGITHFIDRGTPSAGQRKRINPSGRYISWSDAVKFLLDYTTSREGAEYVISTEYKAGTLTTFKNNFKPKDRVLYGSARRECPDYAYFYEGQILGLAARASNSTISRWDAISHSDDAVPGKQNDLKPAPPERYTAWETEIVNFSPDIKEAFENYTVSDLFKWLTKSALSGRAAQLKRLTPPHRFQCHQPEPKRRLYYTDWDGSEKSVSLKYFQNTISKLRHQGHIPIRKYAH